MSCTASLVAVEVAPGAQAYIAVIVAQVNAKAIITFPVHLQLESEARCSEGACSDYAAQTPALWNGA